jgi:hypothetical protein
MTVGSRLDRNRRSAILIRQHNRAARQSQEQPFGDLARLCGAVTRTRPADEEEDAASIQKVQATFETWPAEYRLVIKIWPT